MLKKELDERKSKRFHYRCPNCFRNFIRSDGNGDWFCGKCGEGLEVKEIINEKEYSQTP